MVLSSVLTTPLTSKFPVEKTQANSSLPFTGGIAPMHMLVSMYYCIHVFIWDHASVVASTSGVLLWAVLLLLP